MSATKEAAKAAPLTFAADKVERRKVADLIPYPSNPRTHSQEQIDSLVAMISEFGFTSPLLIDEEDMILAGHGRTMAAKHLKFDELPVIVLRGLSEAQKRAIVIADNQASELAGWDNALLKIEVGELKTLDFDLKILGFSDTMTMWLTSGDLVDNPGGEWAGMPSFSQNDKTAFKSLAVHFKDQAAVDAFARAIKQKIAEGTRSIWYPETEIETYADKRYTAT